MNKYQSPYIDGQVVEPDNAEPVRQVPESAPLPVAQPDAKISGCTKSASDCLHKTTKLAREFNHGTVSAAHLILAMTLIPNASRQFELRKMDIDRAFRAAMLALMEIERGSPSNGALPGLSEEFNVIVTLAQELARNRDNQEVSVDDLLTALDRLPADSSAAQLVRGERKSGIGTTDTNEALAQLALAIDQQLHGIRQSLEMLRLDMPREDLDRVKRYLEQRDGQIERLIKDGFAAVERKPASPLPDSSDDAPRVTPSDGPVEDTLWDKIFGRKAPEAPPPAADPAQTRWGL
ncbi:MAG: Clp protease N-terminal domain-containing protein [Pseudorhodoplanes sp.]